MDFLQQSVRPQMSLLPLARAGTVGTVRTLTQCNLNQLVSCQLLQRPGIQVVTKDSVHQQTRKTLRMVSRKPQMNQRLGDNLTKKNCSGFTYDKLTFTLTQV